MKRVLSLFVIVLVAGLTLAACKTTTTGSEAKAKAAATSTAVTQDKSSFEKLVKPCVPSNQVSLAVSKSARQTFAECVGVPKDQREAFENALLTAAEHTPHIASLSPAGTTARHDFLNNTVPPLVVKYRSAK